MTRSFGQIYTLLVFFSLAACLSGCGSEKDQDKKSAAPSDKDKKDPGKTDPSKNGDQKAKSPYVFEAKTPVAASPQGCSSPLTLEVVVGPEFPSGSQTFLVANLAPACFENRFPVLRLKIDKSFRISAPVSCKKASIGEYNFECTGAVGQFVVEGRVAVPVTSASADNFSALKAEVEFVVPPAQ